MKIVLILTAALLCGCSMTNTIGMQQAEAAVKACGENGVAEVTTMSIRCRMQWVKDPIHP